MKNALLGKVVFQKWRQEKDLPKQMSERVHPTIRLPWEKLKGVLGWNKMTLIIIMNMKVYNTL